MNYEERKKQYEKYKDLAYYILIGLLSLIAVVFLPFLGSYLQGEIIFPDTVMGWIIYILTKLSVAAINVLMFHLFIKQAKVNVKDNADFNRAEAILKNIHEKIELEPRSPSIYFRGTWLKKGTTMVIMTVLSVFTFSEAILNFDLSSFLSYCFTVVLGAIFGYIQMRSVEDYWTSEYLYYALKQEKTLLNEDKVEINKKEKNEDDPN